MRKEPVATLASLLTSEERKAMHEAKTNRGKKTATKQSIAEARLARKDTKGLTGKDVDKFLQKNMNSAPIKGKNEKE